MSIPEAIDAARDRAADPILVVEQA